MSMRELTAHKIGGAIDRAIQVMVLDEPGHGGACHKYGVNFLNAPGCSGPIIKFQEGPVVESGLNGLTHEVLLAILIDRLEGFQKGAYACNANEAALWHLEYAMKHLQNRTRERLGRGVEGTHAL